MIQQQIAQFTNSLQNIATEYSDPTVILQHMPVLKDFPMLQQNPEYLGYGLGGIVGLFVLKKIIFKRRKAKVNNIAMVMPKPYKGAAEEMEVDGFDKDDLHARVQENGAEPLRIPKSKNKSKAATAPTYEIPEPAPRKVAEPSARTPAQQLEDVGAIGFTARPALTPDEARMRVVVQSVLNEFGAGYMIMARTALSALIEPGRESVGAERAKALSAIQSRYVDFGIFDRAGRCVLALEVNSSEPQIASKAMDKSIVQKALAQTGLPLAKLTLGESPAEVRAHIAPYLKATGRVQPLAQSKLQTAPTKKAPRPGRPVRPMRPAHAAAIAAE
ncbi:DUF2726 domain-containing protein [Planktotalea sp.]|uniref:DUF2726 domain-containing protein n=1 Tax=Planktotalea sp. TaxID=2029877 RepID=UPI003D6C1B5A